MRGWPQSWDLLNVYHEMRSSVIQGWVAPALWVGLALPLIATLTGGVAGAC